jgi:hypothetical protein
MNKPQTRELFERAARFYDGYPTGQYDEEAAHALRNHFDLLTACQLALDSDDLAVKKYLRAAIAKATNHET